MKEEIKKVIGSRLKLIRIENNDTIESLSKKINISATTIWRYEKGKSDMTIDNIYKILNCYNVNSSIFFEQVNAKMHRTEG